MTNIICVRSVKPLVLTFTVLLLFAKTLYAQDEPLSSKRVYSVSLPIEVMNTVGGTVIDTYVVHLNKGQKVHVQVENKTDHSRVYFDSVLAETETRFGTNSSENEWSGVVPESGVYEIRVAAYPVAKYKLLVYAAQGREDDSGTAVEPSTLTRLNPTSVHLTIRLLPAPRAEVGDRYLECGNDAALDRFHPTRTLPCSGKSKAPSTLRSAGALHI